MSYALQRLARNAMGACAQLRAKFRGLFCQKSFPMMRRLFDALVLPTISYGSEVWALFAPRPYRVTSRRWLMSRWPSCGSFAALKRSVTPAIVFRELSDMPWVHRWWNQVIGFMHRLSNRPEDSIHAEVLRDNIADAQEHPSYGNWAGGIIKQYRRLGFAVVVLWHNVPELPRVLGKDEGSALQGLGRLACNPKNSPLQKGKALHILCMISAPQSAAHCALL